MNSSRFGTVGASAASGEGGGSRPNQEGFGPVQPGAAINPCRGNPSNPSRIFQGGQKRLSACIYELYKIFQILQSFNQLPKNQIAYIPHGTPLEGLKDLKDSIFGIHFNHLSMFSGLERFDDALKDSAITPAAPRHGKPEQASSTSRA